MADWNSGQYLKFEGERTQPAIDLAQRIANPNPKRILDLGCGPGNSTRVLRERFPGAEIVGADNSPDMLERAKEDYPELEFRLFDATRDFAELGGKWDVIFSNACLQWVPDHRNLLPRLLAALRPGGELAVQTPLQSLAPVHRMLGELAAEPEWRGYFGKVRELHNLTDVEYADLLSEHAASFALWKTDYYHILPSHRAVLEWYRGTGLRPWIGALPEEWKPIFEAALLQRIEAAFTTLSNGTVLFPFPRLFFTAVAK